LITDSADPIDHLNPGFEGLLGAGRINAGNCFTTGIEENFALPGNVGLINNYPNPFNAQTRILFQLNQTSEVILTIYDILGRKVDIIEAGERQPGSHSILWDADRKPSGIYFARLTTNGKTDIVKMVLLK